MEKNSDCISKVEVISWLQEQEKKFNDYLNEVKRHKARMISPKVQGQVMASAGSIAFIRAEIDYLNSLNCDVHHNKLEEEE